MMKLNEINYAPDAFKAHRAELLDQMRVLAYTMRDSFDAGVELALQYPQNTTKIGDLLLTMDKGTDSHVIEFNATMVPKLIKTLDFPFSLGKKPVVTSRQLAFGFYIDPAMVDHYRNVIGRDNVFRTKLSPSPKHT